MTLDQLRYFTAAAKYEHIHRAAHSIPISASVVSQAVKTLEDEFGYQLFIRENKKIKLTSHGVRLLELSQKLLGQAESLKKELGQTDQPLSGHYRIGSSHFLAAKLLTPAWVNLQTRFPLLVGDIYSQATWVLVDSLIAGRLDFGIGFSPVPHPQLEYEEIYRGHSVVVARKNHPIFERDKKHPYKLLPEYPATMHMSTEKIFSARHYPIFKNANFNINFGFDSDFAAIENLRSSNNWSLMIDLIVAEFKEHLRIVSVPYKSETTYTIQLMKHKSRKTDAVMAEAYAQIKERVQKMKTLG